MAAFMPAWRPFDASHSVRLLSERPLGGGMVALCSSPGLSGTAEGARLAMAVARRWAEGGLSIVLADGDVAAPTLHQTVGKDNTTGLADLLLSGWAWESVAVPAEVPGLRVLPAGGQGVATDPVGARGRLSELAVAVSGVGATLALYVPLGSSIAGWALEICTDVVVLANESERTQDAFAPDEDRIRAVVGLPPPQAPWAREPVPGRRSAWGRESEAHPGPPPAAPAPRAQTGLWEESPAGQESLPHTSTIEDRWAAAAAALRAQREAGRAPAGPAEEPPPAPPPPRAALPALPDLASVEEPAPRQVLTPPRPRRNPPALVEEPRPPGEWNRPPAEATSPAPAPRPPGPARPEPRAVRPEEPPPIPTLDLPEWSGGGESPGRDARPDRRGLVLRVAGMVIGVAVVAGVVWIWNSARSLPPYEVPSSSLPRAGAPAAASSQLAEATAPPADATPAPATDSVAAPSGDTAAAPAPAPTVGAGRAPSPGEAEAASPLQRFSWSLAAMGSYDGARALVERLRRAAPGEVFAIAPIEAGGRTLYRVLGGVAESRDALAGSRESMAAAARAQPESILPREAPLAFALQDFADAEGARGRAEELWRSGVPAYVLAVDRGEGARVWRIYAGAYASEAEAAALRSLLRDAGIPDPLLTDRRGRSGG